MKVGGVEVTKCEEVLVLPRHPDPIVFRAQAVPTMQRFEELCPKPTPALRTVKGGKTEPHISEAYVEDLNRWSEQRYAFICVTSLIASDIEWDTVDIDKPNTWVKWMDELREAGLSDVEINRVQTLVLDANSLNESKLKAARESFLLGQGAAKAESSGPHTTQESSQSGKPAND